MLTRSVIARRIVRLAALAAIACAAWIPIHGARLRPAALPAPRTFAASSWAATLPAALTSPAFEPTLRLVSMVADDIDADGDLDVVANDGSLDLIVWINDGTGRLTRQSLGGDRAKPRLLAGLRLSHQPAGSPVTGQLPGSSPALAGGFVSNPIDASPWRDAGASNRAAVSCLSTRAPRGPPAPASAV